MHEFLFLKFETDCVYYYMMMEKMFSHKIVVHLPSVHYHESLPKYLGPIYGLWNSPSLIKRRGQGLLSHEKRSTIVGDLCLIDFAWAFLSNSTSRYCRVSCHTGTYPGTKTLKREHAGKTVLLNLQ